MGRGPIETHDGYSSTSSRGKAGQDNRNSHEGIFSKPTCGAHERSTKVAHVKKVIHLAGYNICRTHGFSTSAAAAIRHSSSDRDGSSIWHMAYSGVGSGHKSPRRRNATPSVCGSFIGIGGQKRIGRPAFRSSGHKGMAARDVKPRRVKSARTRRLYSIAFFSRTELTLLRRTIAMGNERASR